MAKFISILVAALVALASPIAQAAEGSLNAVSKLTLPGNFALSVKPLDDSDQALALKDQFEKTLAAKGHQIDPKSPLVFTFEILDELGAYSVTDRRYFVELQAKGSRTGGEDAHARFNVFDSNKGGIINKGSGGTKIVTPSKYRLKVTIDGPAGPGRLERFWHGTATGKLGASNSETLIKAMVAPLVDAVGKTVRSQAFPLPN